MLKKLLWFVAAVVCFAISYFVAVLLKDAFATGGFVRFKHLLGPIAFFVIGIIMLYRFFSSMGLKKALSYFLVGAIMVGAGGLVIYLNSWSYQQNVMVDRIVNNKVSAEEARKLVLELLFGSDATEELREKAKECVDVLVSRGDSWAMTQQAEWLAGDGNFEEALALLLKAKGQMTDDDLSYADVCKSIAMYYEEGNGVAVDKETALDYYIEAYRSRLINSDYDLNHIQILAYEVGRQLTDSMLTHKL